jgi:hypothetical protein
MARTSSPPTEAVSIKRISLMIGFHHSLQQTLVALESAGIEMCERTVYRALPLVEPFGRVALATFGFVSPFGLGLEKGIHPLYRIMQAAAARGLQPCPPEAAATVRLAYTDQPDGEWAIMAMRNFCDLSGTMVNFVLGHVKDQRILRTENADGEIGFKSDALFIFLEKVAPSVKA